MEGPHSCRDRWQYSRFPVQWPLDFWETPDVVRGGLVADISEVGVRIHSVHPIQIGAELKIRVYVLNGEYAFGIIWGSGRIIWRTLHREGDWKGYAWGLYLTEMTTVDRERLRQLLIHQREFQEDPSETRGSSRA